MKSIGRTDGGCCSAAEGFARNRAGDRAIAGRPGDWPRPDRPHAAAGRRSAAGRDRGRDGWAIGTGAARAASRGEEGTERIADIGTGRGGTVRGASLRRGRSSDHRAIRVIEWCPRSVPPGAREVRARPRHRSTGDPGQRRRACLSPRQTAPPSRQESGPAGGAGWQGMSSCREAGEARMIGVSDHTGEAGESTDEPVDHRGNV